MFRAELLSLSSGVSYSDVEILEPHDFEIYGVDKIFGDDTFAFYAGGSLIYSQIIGLRIIRLSKQIFAGARCMKAERLVIDKDISYDNCSICLDVDQLNIPTISLHYKTFVFNNEINTHYTLARNVVSIINKDNRHGSMDKVVPIRRVLARQESPKETLTAKIK